MRWTTKLEAGTEWGDTQTIEIGCLARRVAGLAPHEVGLPLDEAKELLAELQRRIVQTRIDEKVSTARVLQTLLGTVRVAVPRLKLCAGVNKGPFGDVSFSPLSKLLPDRCTSALRRLRAEIAASDPGIVVAIDGAHIRAVPGRQTRYLDVTVSKIGAAGYSPRRFALAPSRTERPLVLLRAALRDAGGRTPLGLQPDWVVVAAWLVQLRSRLLLPAEAQASDTANRQAAQLRRGLARLDTVQAAARWLDRQPRLGRDVFARGRPELMGIGTTTLHQVDVIEFLWASLALLDDDLPPPDTASCYRPVWIDLHLVPDARDRILQHMAGRPGPCRLDQLLPDVPGSGTPHDTGLRGRSRWTSTFVASLELAKQGHVVLEQDEEFSPIQVSLGLVGRERPGDMQQTRDDPAHGSMDETRALAQAGGAA